MAVVYCLHGADVVLVLYFPREVWKMSSGYMIKKSVVSTSLLALGVSFDLLSRYSQDMKDEIADWDEGMKVCLGVLPDGPYIAIQKSGDRLKYLGKGHHDARLKILFKNMDSALMMLTGQMGAHTGFAQHRAIVHGSIGEAMMANRAMALVTKFLFPGFMLGGITKRKPEMSGDDYVAYAKFMAVLTPMLILNAAK